MSEVLDLMDEFKTLVEQRKPYETVWDDIDANLLPNIMRLAESSAPQKGARRDEKINDGGPRYALSTFQAGFMGRIMSPQFDFFSVQTPDEDLADDRNTRMWLSKLNQAIFMLINRSKFFPQTYCLLGVAGGMGTATMYHEYDNTQRKVMFSLRNPWEIYISDDENGDPDMVDRLTLMSYRNIASKFKNDTLDPEVIKFAESPDERNKEIHILHVVKPNPSYDPRKRDARSKRYKSWYIDYEHQSIIRPGGYSVMPYSIWAIDKEVGEPYGRGPGWRALSDIKGLYATAKTNMVGGQYQVNPAADIPQERKGTEQLVPGGRNYYEETGREIKVIQKVIDLKAGLEREQHKQQIIERHFMVPFFTAAQQALTGKARERTAYEVQQIEREVAILLGPYATGFQSQYMESVIGCLVYYVIENRMVPPPPPQLMQSPNGNKLQIVYTGPLALAEKAFFNTEPYRRTLQDIQTIMSTDPTGESLPRQIFDIPDWDRFFREMAQGNGLPEEGMLETRKIFANRQARAKALEEQRKLAALEQMGKAMPGLNQPVQPGSAADAINKKGAPVASGT